MIKTLKLSNFKCFEKLKLELGNLTLLTGNNSSGKSSILQSLGVLHETIKNSNHPKDLQLNGRNFHLGTLSDIVNKNTNNVETSIEISSKEEVIEWVFRTDKHFAIKNPLSADLYNQSKIVDTIKHLTYINAMEEPIAYELDVETGYVKRNLVLDYVTNSYLNNINYQLNLFFPGVSIVTHSTFDTNYFEVKFVENGFVFDPANFSLGINQFLHILIACVKVKDGGLLLFENPEGFLDQYQQSKIGEFLAEVASNGVQILVETHSDHVLNGIRKGVYNKQLPASDTKIYFFNKRFGSQAQFQSLNFDENGNLDSWPNGFFDQFEKDANFLLGWSN